MKKILVFRFSLTEGPGYLETFLNLHMVDWELIKIDLGEPVPDYTDNISGIALMGGPMSVNDNLSWIEPILQLIRKAIINDIPIIGHCLGGQLLAKSLNAAITTNPYQEIGWGEVNIKHQDVASEWFGAEEKFNVFHWHYETFDIPHDATHILGSNFCKNQAFVFNNIHIGFQCHIEMTEALVRQWCKDSEDDLIDASKVTSVQSSNEILLDIKNKITKLNVIANNVYTRWLINARH